MHTDSTLSKKIAAKEEDILPIQGTYYVEFYVGNARQAAYYYHYVFGFDIIAYRGPETGHKGSTSYLLAQNKLRFVLTSSLTPDSPIAAHVHRHGDGIKDIALWVEDARKSFEETVSRGAEAVHGPYTLKDDEGEVVMASIATYGDTIHTFVENRNYQGLFLPGFRAWKNENLTNRSIGLKYVDHIVGNVDLGDMNKYVQFYADVMGFKQLVSFDDKDISTKYTALMSKVMSNGNERIKFPINEPAPGLKKSQIDEYLEFYRGAGVQHIAIATDDIIQMVSQLRNNGLEFLRVPDTYYDTLKERVGDIEEPIEELRKLGVLVDRDEEGYLLQIFTKPVQDRPTVFYEIIERKGARSFGKGNFKALFEAIEREQELRGNL
ncbi:4-hydroxyphenylpyruvate dioxygenase [Catalinimonas niigatensis]|uniref:4-hydroxyphenylpyruvate dioxygenase n=1 Tax=Catalinimonas niigatensis TaxID=1397264 RepID=UPI00266649EB|nr:4-hydroxyphenylpyruvate dioxygenase [Catalinimonas niigatensis]WPP53559.1 4-hydroxyphenylpyruvate dioxygenase [Catalinimonas niigatensis]